MRTYRNLTAAFLLGLLQVILPLCLTDSASAIRPEGVVPRVGQPQEERARGAAPPDPDRKVINVVIDKIQDGYLYSTDRRSFRIDSDTKVIKNAGAAGKVKIAELVFENSRLISVKIK